MALRGCIRVHGLSLQILLGDNPSWKGSPVAVTREEKPQSPILDLNPEAREKGLVVGVRYSSALSLVPGLRARPVPPERIQEERGRIARLLSSFTPDIEPCPFDQDAFWVSVEGLRSLFGSESRWVRDVDRALASSGFPASIMVGFTRFGTYALARTGSRPAVFASREEEQALVGRSSIDVLPLPHKTRSILRKLEVRTVGQFVRLPPGETERRLGREAGLLRQLILSDDPLPIQPLELKERVACRRRLDAPLVDLALLVTHIGELLEAEAARVRQDKAVISALTLTLRTEDGEESSDLIRPAAPTLKTEVLLRLVQLRLSERRLASGVQDIEIRCARTHPSGKQEELFCSISRDLQAGARAFAAIRARFGNGAVAGARLDDSHLPERSFRWAPLLKPVLPSPRPQPGPEPPTAVRRILFSPRTARLHIPDESGGLIASGSWWGERGQDAPFLREYRFRDSPEGILWLYQDRLARTWWIQGAVD
jgi:protein ImuB